MCIEYHIEFNMYYVSAQGVDEHAINVHHHHHHHHYLSLRTARPLASHRAMLRMQEFKGESYRRILTNKTE